MKKIIILLTLSTVLATASTCSYAKQQAEHFSIRANNYKMNTQSGACNLADNLEQVVNWMGTMKQNSCAGYNASTFQIYTQMLMSASMKCGH